MCWPKLVSSTLRAVCHELGLAQRVCQHSDRISSIWLWYAHTGRYPCAAQNIPRWLHLLRINSMIARAYTQRYHCVLHNIAHWHPGLTRTCGWQWAPDSVAACLTVVAAVGSLGTPTSCSGNRMEYEAAWFRQLFRNRIQFNEPHSDSGRFECYIFVEYCTYLGWNWIDAQRVKLTFHM